MKTPVAPARVWLAGSIALVLAAAANLGLRTLAVAMLPGAAIFSPLEASAVTTWTVIGVVGATVVRLALAGSPAGGIWFLRVALVALVVSWLPDVALLVWPMYKGATLASVGTLMAMHAVAAAVCILVLTRPFGK
jgi:hypothetical protein